MTGDPAPLLDPGLTVDEVMASHPATMPIFNAFGIDICCGAGRAIRDAATLDGADLAALLEALGAAMEETE